MAKTHLSTEELAAGSLGDNSIAADRLKSIVSRIERLNEKRKALGEDIKDLYQEAKSAGFDNKVLRQLIRERQKNPGEVEEQDVLRQLYRRALEKEAEGL